MDAERVYIQTLQVARQSRREALRLEADLFDIVDRIRDSKRLIEESRRLLAADACRSVHATSRF